MDGLILLDKPKGPTSAQISLWVKNIVGKKAAHCGTLDPDATGVLPVLFGKGIKLLKFLLEHDKEYVCLFETEKPVEAAVMEKTLAEFRGKVFQAVPEISAVAKKTRVRRIYNIELLEIDEKHALFRVFCQHGTYVRALVSDVGRLLGMQTKMVLLRRTRVNGFTEDECITLTKLNDAAKLGKLDTVVLPLEEAVRGLPKAIVKSGAVAALCHGANLMAPGFVEKKGHITKDSPVALFTAKNELIGIGSALCDGAEMDKKKRGAIVKTKKIVMEKNRYPKMW